MAADNLQELMNTFATLFAVTKEKYPDADLSTTQRTLAFTVDHSLKHLQKSLGKIAAEREVADHGGAPNEFEMRIATAKMFNTVVNLARVLGMDGEKLGDLAVSVARAG